MILRILITAFLGLFFLQSCGPAAEDREMMYARARVFQDSIANVIRTSMNQTYELTKWPYMNQSANLSDTTKSKTENASEKKAGEK
jgi:hypothetical protein